LRPRTKLEKSTQIEGLIWNLMRFGASFCLNETVCFGQNDTISCISLKREREREREREANSVVLNGTISLLLPLDAQRTGEEED
jgi:hypothetical protein